MLIWKPAETAALTEKIMKERLIFMKKLSTILLALAAVAVLAGCSGSVGSTTETTTAAVGITANRGDAAGAANESPANESPANGNIPVGTSSAEQGGADKAKDEEAAAAVRVGSLKGPTSMGLVSLMDLADRGESKNSYEFTMAIAADELSSAIVSGSLDIALVPANVASILYHKTSGGISVIDINTLGVLDVVASDDSIQSFADLKGKTVYMTGKGTTPDYVFQYLLKANGLGEDDVTLEFKSEAAEVAAALKEETAAIGVLPQPFATAACMQNESLRVVLDLTKEWDAVQGAGGSRLVTGVTIVRGAFLKEHGDIVDTFLEEHKASAAYTASDPQDAARLIAARGIIEKAPIAEKALPYCNITCLTDADMKASLGGYLQVLADLDPKSIGGGLPSDDFYYIP